MAGCVSVRVEVSDIAAAMQDDPAQMVELLSVLAAVDFMTEGGLTQRMEVHAPVRIESLRVFIGRLAAAFGAVVAA